MCQLTTLTLTITITLTLTLTLTLNLTLIAAPTLTAVLTLIVALTLTVTDRTLLQQGKCKEVLSTLEESVMASFEKLGDSRRELVEASALTVRAHAMAGLKQWEEAVAEFECAREVYKTVYKAVGGFEREEVMDKFTGDVSMILAAVKRSDEIRACVAALRGEAMIMEYTGHIHRRRHGANMDQEGAKDAVNAYVEAMLLYAKIGDVPNSGASAFSAAKIHFTHGNAAAAASAAASAATSFVLVNQHENGASAMRLQGLCKAKMGDIGAASELLQASMAIGAEAKLPEQVARSADALADLMPASEDQRTGYKSAAGAYKAAKLPLEEARALTKLSESMLQHYLEDQSAWKGAAAADSEYSEDTKSIDEALENLERAMSIFSNSQDEVSKADCHMSFGLAHTLRGELTSAAEHFKIALDCEKWSTAENPRAQQARTVLNRMSGGSGAPSAPPSKAKAEAPKEGEMEAMDEYAKMKRNSDSDRKKFEVDKKARKEKLAKRVAEEKARMEAEEKADEEKRRARRKAREALLSNDFEDEAEEKGEEEIAAVEASPPAKIEEVKPKIEEVKTEKPKVGGFKFPDSKKKAPKKEENKVEKKVETLEVSPKEEDDDDIEDVFTPGAEKAIQEENKNAAGKSVNAAIKKGAKKEAKKEAKKAEKKTVFDTSNVAKASLEARAKEEEAARKKAEAVEVKKKKRAAADPVLNKKKEDARRAEQAEIERELAEEALLEKKAIDDRRAKEETAEKLAEAETAAKKANAAGFDADVARKSKQAEYFKKRQEDRKVREAAIAKAKAAAEKAAKAKAAEKKVEKSSSESDDDLPVCVEEDASSSMIRGVPNPHTALDDEVPVCVEEPVSTIRGVPNPNVVKTAWEAPKEVASGSSDDEELPVCVEAEPAVIRGVANPHVGIKKEKEIYVREIGCGSGLLPDFTAKKIGNALEISAKLTGVKSAGALDFEVSETELELSGHGYVLKLAFLKKMDDDQVKAAFDKAEGRMTMTIDFA